MIPLLGWIAGATLSIPLLLGTTMPPEGVVVALEPTLVPSVHLYTWRDELAKTPWLENLAKCESNINERAVNEMDSDGLKAWGLFQYKIGTWLAFQKEMGVSGLDIMSGADQLRVTRWAMDHGKAGHWGICL